MDIHVFEVGPFTGNVSQNNIRVWGAVKKEHMILPCYGYVRWKEHCDCSYHDACETHPFSASTFGISNHFDGTGICDIRGLRANARYLIQICYSMLDMGPSEVQWPEDNYSYCTSITSQSAGSPHETTFIFGSCRDQGPGFDGDSDETFNTINRLIKNGEIEPPDMLWMCGDQIYIDRPTGLSTNGYEKFTDLYRKQFTETEFSKLMKTTPAYLQMDDHEVENDWSYAKMQHSEKDNQALHNGMRSYNAYQASLCATFRSEEEFLSYPLPAPYLNKYWYKVDRHDSSFFVMDVRYDRGEASDTDKLETWRLGATSPISVQLDELENWIRSSDRDNKVNFIVTSVPFLVDPKRWSWRFMGLVNVSLRHTRKELWYANTKERNRILEAIETSDAHFVFLSGDVHCSFVVSMLTRNGKRIHNVVSSAFNWMSPGLARGDFNWSNLRNCPHQAGSINLINNYVEHKNNFAYLTVSDSGHIEVKIIKGKTGDCEFEENIAL